LNTIKISHTIFCQMAALEPWVLLDFWWAMAEAPTGETKPMAVKVFK
jgi:hypothetical protein